MDDDDIEDFDEAAFERARLEMAVAARNTVSALQQLTSAFVVLGMEVSELLEKARPGLHQPNLGAVEIGQCALARAMSKRTS